MKTMHFEIKGLSCPNCPAKVEKAVLKFDGVFQIKVDYETETGQLTFDDQITSFSDITDRIDKMGFTMLNPKASTY